MRSPRTLVLGAAVAVLVGCSTVPSSVPLTTPTAAPTEAVSPSTGPSPPIRVPSDAPTDLPDPPPIGAAWELAATLDDGEVLDVARGPSGWVAGGWVRCPDAGCNGGAAAAWFSTDGLTWTGGPVSDGRGAAISTVATDGDRWFAAGVGTEGTGDTLRERAMVWRSTDGTEWRLASSISLGPPEKGLGPIRDLAAGPGGAILSWLDPGDADEPERSTVYWSENGETWQPIDKTIFGLPPDGSLGLSRTTVADGRFILVGSNDSGPSGARATGATGRSMRASALPQGSISLAAGAGSSSSTNSARRSVSSASGSRTTVEPTGRARRRRFRSRSRG